MRLLGTSKTLIPNPNSDPYWDKVGFLLHGIEAVDSSSHASAVTATGVTYTATQTKYNRLSATYPGGPATSHFQSVAFNSAQQLGTGDFTIESWMYKTANTSALGNQTFYNHGVTSAAMIGIFLTTAGGIDFVGNNVYFCGVNGATTPISLNAWHHIAVVRQNGIAAIYVDGLYASNIGPYTCTQTMSYTNTPRVGSTLAGSNSSFQGFLSDFRLTVGICRYTTNFTPPTRTLPDRNFSQ